MASMNDIPVRRPPTGQELDREYDELHEDHNADELPTPREEELEKEQELEDYADDLRDPD
jgi:hypothetical protein